MRYDDQHRPLGLGERQKYWTTMGVLALILAILLWIDRSEAACRVQWVDHDYNTFTPAVKKQVCDNTYDVKAYNNPGVRPIQTPRVRPVEMPTVPPVGTRSCRTQQVWENNRWVQKRLCQ